MGTRYAGRANFDGDGNPLWVKFSQMDTPLIYLTVLLTIVLLIGLGVAFFGLAYHHHRRWHEHQRLVEEHEHHRSTRRGAAKA